MINLRTSEERGQGDYGWLKTRYSFSFAQYHDPQYMGFRDLRVINEDWIEPGTGFPQHSHRDMEIITYIIEGALEHEDSLGNKGIIKQGEIQRMSAGSGITHSEYNPSQTDPVHLLQIWLLPGQEGIASGYEQRQFGRDKEGAFQLIASPDAREGSALINQSVDLLAGRFKGGQATDYRLAAGRHAWVQMVSGELLLNDFKLQAGDGAAVSDEELLRFKFQKDSELLLFDLA